MHRRQYEADWERKKEYLPRSMFADPPVLSPIPETRESRSRSLSPRRMATGGSGDRDSPLPELIVERVRRYDDEPEDYYNKLEVKMKRYYRKIFLGEQIDGDDDEMLCDEPVPYYSDDNFEVTRHDEIGEIDNGPEDVVTVDVDKAITNKSSKMAENDSQTASSNSHETLDEIQDNGKRQSGEVTKSLEQRGEPHASSDTFVISSRATSELGAEQSADQLVEIEDKTDNETSKDSSSYEHDNEEHNSDEVKSNEDSNNLGNALNRDVSHKIDSSSSENQALIEEEEYVSHEEAETMRKQASTSIRDSMPQIEKPSKRKTLDLRIERLSMEQASECTVRESVEMEIESDHFSPVLQTSSTLKQVSPTLGFKRVSTALICGKSAKHRKKDLFNKINDKIIEKQAELENFRDVAIETDMGNTIGVERNVQQETVHVAEVGAQTEPTVVRNKSTETDINQADFIMQTEQRETVDFTNVGVQTDTRDYSERGTQTTERVFEYWHILEGINIYFFF